MCRGVDGHEETLADHKPKQTSYCTEIHYLLVLDEFKPPNGSFSLR